MRVGTKDEHQEVVDMVEDVMKGLTHLFADHVHFKSHGAQSSK
jgi:hypothetical protein